MFLEIHSINFNASKISIRHILIHLQIFKRFLNLSTTSIQVHLLCGFYLLVNEQTLKLKK
jgi:hypothetical protein